MDTASIGTTSASPISISSATGAMASANALQGLAASENNYTGQMEYLSGTLGLISAVVGGISSAMKNLGSLGDIGEGLGKALGTMLGSPSIQKSTDQINKLIPDEIQGTANGYRNGTKWDANKR